MRVVFGGAFEGTAPRASGPFSGPRSGDRDHIFVWSTWTLITISLAMLSRTMPGMAML